MMSNWGSFFVASLLAARAAGPPRAWLVFRFRLQPSRGGVTAGYNRYKDAKSHFKISLVIAQVSATAFIFTRTADRVIIARSYC
jgi:hypothetical protein